jgi:ribose 5-phosphate isomerase A
MLWTHLDSGLKWSGEIINLDQKLEVAATMAARLRPGDVVGIGSGSTSFVALQALGKRSENEGLAFIAIPTSAEVAMACTALGIATTTLEAARPDWSFDGADEVDPDRRMIKGRGGALFQEKLLMVASLEQHILIDQTKVVDKLGSRFPVPVEIDPAAISLVRYILEREFSPVSIVLRTGTGKDGPVVTERGNLLFDVVFSEIGPDLDFALIKIPGVIETGLFFNFDVTVHVAGG